MKILMQPDFIDDMKNQLMEEQQRLMKLLAKTKLHIFRDEPVSQDFAEQAVEVENDQVVEALDQGAQIELSQINKALKRIEDDTYGECVVCGAAIQSERLAAIPHTPFCIKCASAK